MRACSIKGCNEKHYAKEYCRNHYLKFSFNQTKYIKIRKIKFTKKCKIKTCKYGYYAKGLCHNHYSNYLNTGSPLGVYRICSQCNRKFNNKKSIKKLICDKCFKKLETLKRYSFKYEWVTGKNNINWKGGVSQYKNHYLMKKQRIKLIKKNNNCCSLCKIKFNSSFLRIHHIDYNKENHSNENLIILCFKCHAKIHKGRRNKMSKFKNIYGLNLDEMSKIFKLSIPTILKLHKKGKLINFLIKS